MIFALILFFSFFRFFFLLVLDLGRGSLSIKYVTLHQLSSLIVSLIYFLLVKEPLVAVTLAKLSSLPPFSPPPVFSPGLLAFHPLFARAIACDFLSEQQEMMRDMWAWQSKNPDGFSSA